MAQGLANWKLVLAYDGTGFDGWQVQPGRPTVQGELAAALERITGERVLPQGSGRTDAGVHALAQVASVALAAPIPPANLQRALNRTLPEAIRVLSAELVGPGFHARHSAVAKTYEYRICRSEVCPPWVARYVYAQPMPLDLAAMQRAAAMVVGEHDFTSFAASDPDRAARQSSEIDENGSSDARDPWGRGTASEKRAMVRVLHRSEWRSEGDLLIYRLTGSGFLHHMVRNLVGTFLDVGRGQMAADSLPAILAARARSSAGPTAPARGLFLVEVEYPPDAGSTLAP